MTKYVTLKTLCFTLWQLVVPVGHTQLTAPLIYGDRTQVGCVSTSLIALSA